jgi:hypothetical protein
MTIPILSLFTWIVSAHDVGACVADGVGQWFHENEICSVCVSMHTGANAALYRLAGNEVQVHIFGIGIVRSPVG